MNNHMLTHLIAKMNQFPERHNAGKNEDKLNLIHGWYENI